MDKARWGPAWLLAHLRPLGGRLAPLLNRAVGRRARRVRGPGIELDVFHGTVHKDSSNECFPDQQNDNNYQPTGIDLTAGLHTCRVLWTASTVSWYLDDNFLMSAPTYSTLKSRDDGYLADVIEWLDERSGRGYATCSRRRWIASASGTSTTRVGCRFPSGRSGPTDRRAGWREPRRPATDTCGGTLNSCGPPPLTPAAHVLLGRAARRGRLAQVEWFGASELDVGWLRCSSQSSAARYARERPRRGNLPADEAPRSASLESSGEDRSAPKASSSWTELPDRPHADIGHLPCPRV